MNNDSGAEPLQKRRRASRAGQAKRFPCTRPGCKKCYSRAEHLHRHELNHSPKKIYRCDILNCDHTFVRHDLYIRHKARHNDQRPSTTGTTEVTSNARSEFLGQNSEAKDVHSNGEGEYLAENVNTVSDTLTALTQWTPMDQTMPKPGASSLLGVSNPSNGFDVPAQQTIISPDLAFNVDEQWNTLGRPTIQGNDNFAAWLFASPVSQDDEFKVTDLPFLDFGLQYSPRDFDEHSSNDENIAFDRHLISSVATAEPPEILTSPKIISEVRRVEICSMLSSFSKKQHRHFKSKSQDTEMLFYSPDGEHFPNLTMETLDNLIANYWLSAQQMPIIHEPTFSSNNCHILLLLAMIALGAFDLVRTKPKGSMKEYKELALLIMTQLRWEIFTDNDAQPPIQLWVAQALLLLEYYEKCFSTRKLHERAHIHHGTTLTLLRRGNPLVGRSESETPPTRLHSRSGSPSQGGEVENRTESSMHSWWLQWAHNESWSRVVFTAFQMDTLHAVMYGHAADMAPYEIRLPLPCDDSLWNANNALEVQRLDANLKMYGVRPINFLEGLKKCLHARGVQTHAAARMLLMSGLLSIGWHIGRREKHLQFLETAPSVREQGRWRLLLLQAFSHWRDSFDTAVGSREGNVVVKLPDYNSARAAVLFHLAHITLHVDFIDCQIFAGTKSLLGREVSKKDFANVVSRMKTWACTPVAKHAALHAYKLLHGTLIKPIASRWPPGTDGLFTATISYNCRTDPIIFRPWAVFMAGLVIWAYQHASSLYLTSSPAQQVHLSAQEEQLACCRYLAVCAAVDDPAHLAPVLSTQDCAVVLSVLSQKFAEADPELLHEASKKLQECREILGMSIMNQPN